MAMVATLTASGCTTEPTRRVRSWFPKTRQEWAEDERFGPTFHEQLADLKKLRDDARQMTPEDQERWAGQLGQMLEDGTNRVLRVAIVRTLGEFPTPTSAVVLRKEIEDGEVDVRIAACEAWGRIGGEQARDLLAGVIGSDTDLDVRMAATRELAAFKDQKTVQALGLALNDTDPALQHRAMQSLKRVTGRDFGNNAPAWREFVQGGSPGLEQPTIATRLRGLF